MASAAIAAHSGEPELLPASFAPPAPPPPRPILPPRPPSPQVNAHAELLPPLPAEPALLVPPATLSLPPPLTAGAMPELPALLAPLELELPPSCTRPAPNILGSALPQPTRIGSSQGRPEASTQARLKVRRALGWGMGFTKVGNPVALELVPDVLSLD